MGERSASDVLQSAREYYCARIRVAKTRVLSTGVLMNVSCPTTLYWREDTGSLDSVNERYTAQVQDSMDGLQLSAMNGNSVFVVLLLVLVSY